MCAPVSRGAIARVPGTAALAEDIGQDVWLILLRLLPGFAFDPARGTLRGWVASIASHEAWRRVRKRSKRAEVPLNDEAADGLLDHDPAPDAEFERMQEHEFFESLVEQFACGLPERERSIVVMHWVEGRTFSEIAGATGHAEEFRGVGGAHG